MSFAAWLTFALAYTLMAVTPGPVVLLVVSYAVSQGRRTAFAVVAGTTLGDATCLVGAMFGLGALLAASATAFTVLKFAGAAYVVILGVKLWRAPPLLRDMETAPAALPSLGRVFLNAYLATTLNPKSVLFFMLFVPQFMTAGAPLLPQFAALLGGVILCGVTVDGGYSVLAASFRRFIRRSRTQKAVNRVAGGLLVGQGIAAAAWRSL